MVSSCYLIGLLFFAGKSSRNITYLVWRNHKMIDRKINYEYISEIKLEIDLMKDLLCALIIHTPNIYM